MKHGLCLQLYFSELETRNAVLRLISIYLRVEPHPTHWKAILKIAVSLFNQPF